MRRLYNSFEFYGVVVEEVIQFCGGGYTTLVILVSALGYPHWISSGKDFFISVQCLWTVMYLYTGRDIRSFLFTQTQVILQL